MNDVNGGYGENPKVIAGHLQNLSSVGKLIFQSYFYPLHPLLAAVSHIEHATIQPLKPADRSDEFLFVSRNLKRQTCRPAQAVDFVHSSRVPAQDWGLDDFATAVHFAESQAPS